jgi:hypothetical protein
MGPVPVALAAASIAVGTVLPSLGRMASYAVCR